MVKSGNSITTNLVYNKDTEEKNGVKVEIKHLDNLYRYTDALNSITFFPNIYIDDPMSDMSNEVNNTKVREYNTFKVASRTMNDKILLGNVLYPLNLINFDDEVKRFINSIEYTGIVLKFNVGDLNITPNRENIIYTSDTINKITDKVKQVKKEMIEIISNKLSKDYDNILEYFAVVGNYLYYDFVNDTLAESRYYKGTYNYSFYVADCPELNITYKGKKLNDYCDYMHRLFNSSIIGLRGLVTNDKVFTSPKNIPYIYRELIKISNTKIIKVDKKFRFLSAIKAYLKENYNNYAITDSIEYSEFFTIAKDCIPYNNTITEKEFSYIADEIFNFYKSNITEIDFNTDTEYLKYKETLSNTKEKKIINEDIILYVYNNYSYVNNYRFTSYDDTLKFIKEYKRGIILDYIDSTNRNIAQIADARGFVLITAKKSIMNLLKEEKFTNIIDKGWLLKKDPVLFRVSSEVKKLNNKGPIIGYWDKIKDTIPSEKRHEISNMLKEYTHYASSYQYKSYAMLDSIKTDSYTDKIVDEFLDYINKYNNIETEAANYHIENNSIIRALIIKTGAYRVSYPVYRKYKNNLIIQKLCKK